MPSVTTTAGSKYPVMIPADSFEHPSIAYIDLDLPGTSKQQQQQPRTQGGADAVDGVRGGSSSSASGHHKSSVSSASSAATPYQKIDFVKTEAFRRMRHRVEEKYNQE